MSAINRPIPSILDRNKVDNMKKALQTEENKDDLTPIVSTRLHNYYELRKANNVLLGCASRAVQG